MSSKQAQIARIHSMSLRLGRVLGVVKQLSADLDKWEAVQKDIAALDKYYSSDLWRQDFEDDEAGRLPEELNRGALSEDGIWNLLNDCKELKERLKDLK